MKIEQYFSNISNTRKEYEFTKEAQKEKEKMMKRLFIKNIFTSENIIEFIVILIIIFCIYIIWKYPVLAGRT